MAQDLFSAPSAGLGVPQGEDRETLRLYLKYADRLLASFGKWKDIDRFYFIPVGLDMTYALPGGAFSIASPPYHIGTVLRNSLSNGDLFGTECECGERLYAYAYNGSPLSGRVDMSCACPHCGAHRRIALTCAWRKCSDALLKSREEDETLRLSAIRAQEPQF
ncbi:MAG: hypothetical protein Q4B16_05980 [Bacteroidia bacterium]|nr:hypothetical protein [Bacteroidia bacterium]